MHIIVRSIYLRKYSIFKALRALKTKQCKWTINSFSSFASMHTPFAWYHYFRNDLCYILAVHLNNLYLNKSCLSRPKNISLKLFTLVNNSYCVLLRKEVIQPHLPIRLPCYDFTLIIKPTFGGALPFGLCYRLRVFPTLMV